MRYKGIFIILLIASSTALFVPILNLGREIKLYPLETKNVNININRPKLQITSDITTGVDVSIYRYKSGDLELISQFKLNINKTLEKLSPGYYVFEFTSSELGTIYLSPKGLYTVPTVLFFILLIINLYFLYDKFNHY